MPGTKRYQHVIETPEPGEWEERNQIISLGSNPLTHRAIACSPPSSHFFLLIPVHSPATVQSTVASQERTEDSALYGIDELKKVAAGKKRVTVIGISVGLSAPFVAGQMDYCTDNTAVFLPVLVGFNPVSMARNDPIEDWRSTFRPVVEWMQKMQEKQEAFVLNPAIGPEGLSGSSWMKGRSATKILLETLLLAAHRTVDQGVVASQRCLLDILRTFERAHQVASSVVVTAAMFLCILSPSCPYPLCSHLLLISA
ncbi:glucokinase regulatory protein [Microtus oregoni]|uniref:glucokinase regulatory protein n=1 Tax=Microtus oregoni TaxID=111838 RepID=UPI001BB243D5|nr:glucokinase regulatory protein [Microtus oregoni]